MAFYLEKAIFINRAPFEHLELNFKEKGVNVLSAVNGRGKTTILSHIVDAFYELARPIFPNQFKGIENLYYRYSSPLDIIEDSKTSVVFFRFKNDSQVWDYIDIRNKIEKDEYEKICSDNKIAYDDVVKFLEKEGNIKKWSKDAKQESIKAIFCNNLLTYFPAYRYETPGFLNDPYKFELSFKKDLDVSGYLPNDIEIISDLRSLSNWLMDIILDLQLYKSDSSKQLRNNFNLILSKTLSGKISGDCRIGIGPRNNAGSRISIVQDKSNKINEIYPSIFNISSGEAALLCLFGELLHQADNNNKLLDISGIVLVDEVDKHLHIKLQKETLPQLFNLFPNIQFIVSSHSPFLNMGLADEAIERTQVFDLDNNGFICEPKNNKLYQDVYEMMIKDNQRFAEKYTELEKELAKNSKPIVITEGKTDIKHILKAKEKLGITDIDFETIECENQPDGDSNLIVLLEQLGKVARNNKVIGIFDRDKEDTIRKIERDGQNVKEYGHGVYAFCIPVPTKRQEKGQNKISIEYLYSDDEIKTVLENGCRLFFGTEFSKHSLFHNTEPLSLATPKGKGEDKILENNGGQAVYDKDDNNHLAKKDEFAEAIKNDKIQISIDSWNNFNPIFDTIRDTLKR